MPATDRTDDVDTLLSEQQLLEDRKRALRRNFGGVEQCATR